MLLFGAKLFCFGNPSAGPATITEVLMVKDPRTQSQWESLRLNGKKFDSSYDRETPVEFLLGKGAVIRGWEEAFPKISLGEKALLKVPSALAYGSKGTTGIPPNSPLTFEVELLGINGQRPLATAQK